MSRRAHVRWAFAILALWGTLDRPVTAQSTPTGRDQATRSVDVAPHEPPTSVAVIPFTNISRHPGDTWLSRGIAETVTADLGELRGLAVIGPEQLWAAGRVELGAALAVDLGRQLGATWLVRGGYQRVGARIRITARLVDARDGTPDPVGEGRWAGQRHLRPSGPARAGAGERTRPDGRGRGTGGCCARAPRAVSDRERRAGSCWSAPNAPRCRQPAWRG